MTQIEKMNIMAKVVISGTIKIVIIMAINSIIFAPASIRLRADNDGHQLHNLRLYFNPMER